MEWIALFLFVGATLVLMAGFPVAFSLGGTALIFAFFGTLAGVFDVGLLGTLPNRVFAIMDNQTLIAVPLFIFMGLTLERSRVAESLLETMALLFGGVRGGLGISVTLVGMLMAASTGIVGATVVTMGLLSLPTMLRRGYDPALSAGTICASGALGQIIPPSIVLVLLGDVVSNAYQEVKYGLGGDPSRTVGVGDLFVGAVIPGLLLVVLYILYVAAVAWLRPGAAPAIPVEERRLSGGALFILSCKALAPPLLLMVAVLGSILGGQASPTEAASVGAVGALLLALAQRQLTLERLREVMEGTLRMSAMVFTILVGASIFSLVFRGFGGDRLIHHFLEGLGGGAFGAMLAVMALMFVLGFFLDFLEIVFVVIPLVGPPLLAMGLDPIWFGVMIAINLQTSFLTPPFGFALFYLRGVAPPELRTGQIYRGVAPFILIQLATLGLLSLWPGLATWLPLTLLGR